MIRKVQPLLETPFPESGKISEEGLILSPELFAAFSRALSMRRIADLTPKRAYITTAPDTTTLRKNRATNFVTRRARSASGG